MNSDNIYCKNHPSVPQLHTILFFFCENNTQNVRDFYGEFILRYKNNCDVEVGCYFKIVFLILYITQVLFDFEKVNEIVNIKFKIKS